MADFLSQFIGKDETPSAEFKHHRGNRKVSDSTTDTEFRIKDLRGDELKVKMDAIVKKINPLLTFVGVGTDFASHTLDFKMEVDGDIHTIELPYDETTTVEDVAKMISPDVLEYPVVSDSTKKVSDAEGDDDDDDFEDEPEREFTDEEIIDFARNHDGFGYSLYEEAYRDKGYDDDIWETMDRLDDVIVDQPASWLLDRMFYGDFNPRHAYWRFNGYGNLESFDGSFESLFDKHIDETVMVEYIRDNMDKYREYLEEYFEDDED